MNRNKWINLRGLSVIAVVLIHSTAEIFTNNYYSLFNLFLNQISRFAVPVFFVSSGYGLYISNKQTLQLNDYYKNRFGTLLPIYFFVSMLYFLVFSSDKSVLRFVVELVTGTAYAHLYYIPVLLFFYLIFPFTHQHFVKPAGIIMMFVTTLSSQLLFQLNLIPIFGMAINVFNWVFYFAFGVFIAKNKSTLNQLIKKSEVIYAFGLGLILFSAYYSILFTNRSSGILSSSMRPTVIIYSIGMIVFSLKRFNIPNLLLREFDKHSLLIYLIHPVFIAIMRNISINLEISINYVVINIIIFIISLMGSYISSIITFYILNIVRKNFRNDKHR